MPEVEKTASAKMMLAEIRELMDGAEIGSAWKRGLPDRQGHDPQPATDRATARIQLLEEIVRELMRPILQRWLDENMPSILEREIKAVLRQSAPGGEQSRGER